MALQIEVEGQGEVVTMRCAGKIVAGASCAQFDQAVHDAARDASGIIVSLAGVPHLDSSGLGALVRLSSALTAQGKSMVFCSASGHVADMLRLTRLDTVLKIFADEAAAGAHIGDKAPAREGSFGADVVCFEPSPDMLVCITSVLEAGKVAVRGSQSAYDVKIMLKTARPKTLVIGPSVRDDQVKALRDDPAAQKVRIVLVDRQFAVDDPTVHAPQLLAQVKGE